MSASEGQTPTRKEEENDGSVLFSGWFLAGAYLSIPLLSLPAFPSYFQNKKEMCVLEMKSR